MKYQCAFALPVDPLELEISSLLILEELLISNSTYDQLLVII